MSNYADIMKQAEDNVAKQSPELHRYKDKDAIGDALITIFFLSIILMGFSFLTGLELAENEVEIVGFSIFVAFIRAWYITHLQSKHSKEVRSEIKRLEKAGL